MTPLYILLVKGLNKRCKLYKSYTLFIFLHRSDYACQLYTVLFPSVCTIQAQ